MRAVILANGDFPKSQALLDEIENASFLAVCDGAVIHLENLQKKPDVIVGDLDSIPDDLKKKYSKEIVEVKEQISNDLSKTFHHCLSLGFDEFLILGATGKREDHTLANISLLLDYHLKCKEVVMKSDFGEFQVFVPPCIISSQKGQQISIFCLDSQVSLSSKNLKYPLSSLKLPLWASGTLNEAKGDCFVLQASHQTQVIVYKHSPKCLD